MGMQALVDRNLTRVFTKTDSTEMVRLIHGHPEEDHLYIPQILTCKQLCACIWSSPIICTSHVSNGFAHAMAHLGLAYMQPCFCWYDVLPTSVQEVVDYDMNN